MAEITVDISNPEDLKRKPFVPMSEGLHHFKIHGPLPIKQSSKQNNMIEMTAKCLDEGDDYGKEIKDYFVIADESWAKQKLTAWCYACGFDLIAAGGRVDTDELLDAEFDATVKHERYKDKQGEDAVSHKISEYLFDSSAIDALIEQNAGQSDNIPI